MRLIGRFSIFDVANIYLTNPIQSVACGRLGAASQITTYLNLRSPILAYGAFCTVVLNQTISRRHKDCRRFLGNNPHSKSNSVESVRYASGIAGVTHELFRVPSLRQSLQLKPEITRGMALPTADHLVVLVHGLWGNPSHLNYVKDALRARYDESELLIHVAARNAGSYTYDGIELGGERLAREIEELIDDYEGKGVPVRKFSIAGYSLGGLVSRYAIGVLYAKGVFDKVKPINFTTFATPHLGVRTPKIGWHNHVWNVLGARTLSASGRQLFTIDKFRDTKRPLLSILADKNLIFWKALAAFKNRFLYANIINDRSVTWYTASFSKYDYFADMDIVDFKYIPGYQNVILDREAGISLKPASEIQQISEASTKNRKSLSQYMRDLPYVALYSVLIPIGLTFFFINAGVQTYSSGRRIKLHGANLRYNIPLVANAMQANMDSMVDTLNQQESADYLPDDEESHSPTSMSASSPADTQTSFEILEKEPKENKLQRSLTATDFPRLALADHQFEMIDSLDQLNFRKFPVHIHKVRHSHAAIIVRNPKNKNFSEGKVVIRHWLDEALEV